MLTSQELRSSSKKDLVQELTTASKTLAQLRIAVGTKHQKDTSLLRKQRHYVAQIKTVIREIEVEELVKTAKTIA